MNDTKTVSGNIVHIEDGSEAPVLSLKVAITPKQSGTGTPSPSNVRPISGWESVSVHDIAGKNLFGGRYDVSFAVYIPANTTFTVSSKHVESDTFQRVYYYGRDASLIDWYGLERGTERDKKTLTVPQDVCYIAFRNLESSEYQVELGTTATAYEPYQGTTTTVNLGRTVYGGTLDVVSGVLTVDRAMITIDGTNYNMAMSGNNKRCYISDSRVPKAKPSPDAYTPAPNLIANYLTAVGDAAAYSGTVGVCIYATEAANIGFTLTGNAMTLDEVKTYLASNPLQVCYELATPQTYQLTPTEVQTLLGENNVWADAGAILEMTYRTETLGIFRKIMIDGRPYFRPNSFELKREDVYAAEYTTCTGKTIADKIGWKYSDMTMKWDILTNEMLAALTALAGETALQFRDSDGTHTERIIRRGFSNTPTRITGPEGTALWTNIEMEVSFINTHTEDEEDEE